MPSTDYKRDERIHFIHKCLSNITHKWSVKKLLEKVNDFLEEEGGKQISARTLNADLKYLELKKFAPIVSYKEGRNVFYKYEEFFELNAPIISTDESLSLVVAFEVLKQLKGFPLIKDLKKISEKLQHQIDENDELQSISFETTNYQKNIHFLQDLYDCIKQKTVIKIKYKQFNNETSFEKKLHPYLLKQYNQRWFLFSYDKINDRIDNSPLDRIIEIKPISDKFNSDKKIKFSTFFDNIIGVSIPPNFKVENIVLQFLGNTGNYIASKPIHQSQESHWLNENTLEVKLKLIVNYELERFILSYSDSVIVVAPKSLKDIIKCRLNKQLEIYKRIF